MVKKSAVEAKGQEVGASGRGLEYWAIGKFKPYADNPRKHTEEVIAQVAEAIDRFGFRVPMLARSDGTVVDGHLRLKAAERLGLEELPVLLCDDMTDEQIRAFRVSVNKMAELAEWDEDLLRKELEAIPPAELGEDGPIGFDLEELDDPLPVDAWDFSPVRDLFVVTLTGSLPLEAEVRERLKGLEGVTIEASTIAQEG